MPLLFDMSISISHDVRSLTLYALDSLRYVLVGLGYTTLCHGYRKTYLYVNSVTDAQICSITGTAYSLFSMYGVEPNVGYRTQQQRHNIRIRINANELTDATAINQHLQQEFVAAGYTHYSSGTRRGTPQIYFEDTPERDEIFAIALDALAPHIPLFTSSVAQVPYEISSPHSWHIFAPIYLDLTTPRPDAKSLIAAHMIR